MNVPVFKKRPIVSFVVLSGLTHLACLGLFVREGEIEFVAPVIPLQAVSVTLSDTEATGHPHSVLHTTIEPVQPKRVEEQRRPHAVATTEGGRPAATAESVTEAGPTLEADEDVVRPEPAVDEERNNAVAEHPVEAEGVNESGVDAVPDTKRTQLEVIPPLRRGEEFLATAREKLTYRITMFGLPIGEAVIEAAREQAGFHITTRIRSNSVISAVYPVDNLVETRLINGNYLVTKIRQREGGVSSDTGFTLKLREKSAFWADRTRNLYANDPLPRQDVLDMLSGFYFLRTHRLEVGKTVELYLYDSNEYASTTVKVLRRERMTLPGSRKIDTLVVHPLLKTEGFFRRNGDVLIWFTDDEHKVPVKMETTIVLGRVTAELVSAESADTVDASLEKGTFER